MTGEASARDDLTFPYCTECDRWMIAARRFCGRHPGVPLSSRRLSGRGVVFSVTVAHAAMSAEITDLVPYRTVLVETEEGPRVLAHSPLEAPLAIGDQVLMELGEEEDRLAGRGRRVARLV